MAIKVDHWWFFFQMIRITETVPTQGLYVTVLSIKRKASTNLITGIKRHKPLLQKAPLLLSKTRWNLLPCLRLESCGKPLPYLTPFFFRASDLKRLVRELKHGWLSEIISPLFQVIWLTNWKFVMKSHKGLIKTLGCSSETQPPMVRTFFF